MSKPLTSLERRILDFIVEYLRRNTYQPSIREIGSRFGIKSTKTVSEYLQSLADKGWIERDSSRSRGVRVIGLDMHPSTVTVPNLEANSTDATLELDRRIAGGAGTFMLSVSADPVAPEGIREGDLILVEPVPASEIEEGDLVVVRNTRGATVRRAIRRGQKLLLDPGSEEVPPAQISGRATSVVRRLRAPATAALANGGSE
ncbi:MAG: LexA family protein [Gemmatimonadota bacterium]